MWWMREGCRPGRLPEFTARAQAFVKQRLLEGEAFVPLRLGDVASLCQATSTSSGSRPIAGSGRVRGGYREGWRLGEELLPSDELLELQGGAPLIQGPP